LQNLPSRIFRFIRTWNGKEEEEGQKESANEWHIEEEGPKILRDGEGGGTRGKNGEA